MEGINIEIIAKDVNKQYLLWKIKKNNKGDLQLWKTKGQTSSVSIYLQVS